MFVHNKCTKNCRACTRRIPQHKANITCTVCHLKYHPKCVGLTPSEITHFGPHGAHNITIGEWICYSCLSDILPIGVLCLEPCNKVQHSGTQSQLRKVCYTCSKIGKLVIQIVYIFHDVIPHTTHSTLVYDCLGQINFDNFSDHV